MTFRGNSALDDAPPQYDNQLLYSDASAAYPGVFMGIRLLLWFGLTATADFVLFEVCGSFFTGEMAQSFCKAGILRYPPALFPCYGHDSVGRKQ